MLLRGAESRKQNRETAPCPDDEIHTADGKSKSVSHTKQQIMAILISHPTGSTQGSGTRRAFASLDRYFVMAGQLEI